MKIVEKNTVISIRLPEELLIILKDEARELGIGYQTHIRMLLLQHVWGRVMLHEKDNNTKEKYNKK